MNANVMTELEILNAALAVGWVKFSYRKADGTNRIAIGTRNKALIEQAIGHRLNEQANQNFFRNCNGYFDLVRGDWRRFNESRFGHIEFDHLTNEQAVVVSLTISLLDIEITPSGLETAKALAANLTSFDFLDFAISSIMGEINFTPNNFDAESERVINVVMPRVAATPKVEPRKTRRDALIEELNALRKRETEILKELLQ